MQFNSIEFLLFFPIVVIFYFLLPHRFKWILLLIASSIFYIAFIPEYIFILFFSIAVDYYAGIAIEKAPNKKKIYLVLSIVVTCLLLFIFKYFNFFNSNIAYIAKFIHWNYPVKALGILLPLGLSFHKLQSLSYVIEVYRGRQKAEHHFGIYSLYVSFFPQLVAGPIERPYNMLHQFREEPGADYQRISHGLKRMAWGFFKKLVIADRLAITVNQVFDNPTAYEGLPLIIASLFFAFQIYTDFSGYSDIAIGTAEVFGIKLMENFDMPYHAKSIPDFWRRWHISLSTWLRDYIFLPISYAISRRIKGEMLFKIKTEIWAYSIGTAITMLIAGLWHGANWTYIAWGGLFGVYLLFSVWTRGLRKRTVKRLHLNSVPYLRKIINVSFTFLLVCTAWIFFRANTLTDAWYIITNLFNGVKDQSVELSNIVSSYILRLGNITFYTPIKFNNTIFMATGNFVFAITGILFIEVSHLFQRRGDVRTMIMRYPVWCRLLLYYSIVMLIVLFGIFDSNEQFIYFQF